MSQGGEQECVEVTRKHQRGPTSCSVMKNMHRLHQIGYQRIHVGCLSGKKYNYAAWNVSALIFGFFVKENRRAIQQVILSSSIVQLTDTK